MTHEGKNCVVSIATVEYLDRVWVLAEGVRAHNPDVEIIIFLADLSARAMEASKLPSMPGTRWASLDELTNGNILEPARQYFNTLEFCCAAKGFIIAHAIETLGFSRVLFLDPDGACFGSLQEIWTLLDQHAVIVTPHTRSPFPSDQNLPDDRECMLAGFINAGFCAVADTQAATDILQWLNQKTLHFGFLLPQAGLYSDQSWLSCLPWYFPEAVYTLRNPSCNVAYWNLHERSLVWKNERLHIDEQPVLFFHLSGYDKNTPQRLTRHSKRIFHGTTEQALAAFLPKYALALNNASHRLPPTLPDKRMLPLSLWRKWRNFRAMYGYSPPFSLGDAYVHAIISRWKQLMALSDRRKS